MRSQILITGVNHYRLYGAVEFYTLEKIDDFEEYGLGVSDPSNGFKSTGVRFRFPNETIGKNRFIYFAQGYDVWHELSSMFTRSVSIYHLYHTNDSIFKITGAEAFVLYHRDQVLDVFGNLGEDGSTSSWKYENKWFYRRDESQIARTKWLQWEWKTKGLSLLSMIFPSMSYKGCKLLIFFTNLFDAIK